MATAPEEVRNQLEFTGGVYGALNTLRSILENRSVNAGRVFACFDHAPPPRRLRLIPEYKEKRKQRNEEELYPFETEEQKAAAFGQISQLRDVLQPLGVETLCYRQREADDIIGALAMHLTSVGETPVIISSDRDMWQMVGWGCRVWDLYSHEIIDAGNFNLKTGVSTDTYLLYKAILGDSSDNIPGVHGLGEARTAALFEAAHWDVRICKEPRDQLAALCDFVGRKKKRTKGERRLLADRKRMEKVLQGIDLRHSFGPDDRLVEKLGGTPEVDWMAFLRTCKQIGLRNVIGNHQSFLAPFRQAAGLSRKKPRRTVRKRKA